MLEPEPVQAADKQTQLLTSNLVQLQCITIHQLDSTYYGEINKSYQKQGLGILQTTEFQTYFGFWKNGKADGKGLIIYPSGSLVYGHFCRNQLSGPVLCDDGVTLKVYVFETNGKINVGYQYVYADSEWRLLKNVNTPKQIVVHNQKISINIKLPDMIAAQHSLYELITSYIAGDFFKPEVLKVTIKKCKGDTTKKQEKAVDKYQDANSWLIRTQKQFWLIGLSQQGNFNGVGCKYSRNKMELIQCGYYRDGLLEGFAFKKEGDKLIIGQYHEGMKHGLFYETTSSSYNIIQYHEDMKFCDHHVKEQTFKKRHKAYHFEQKDFLSAKNLLDFRKIQDTFSPNDVTYYNKKVESPIKTALKQNKQNQDSPKKKQTRSPLKNSLTKALPKPSKKPVSILQKHKISHTNFMNNKIDTEKTSVEMIRQKLQNMSLAKYEKEAREIGEKRHRGLVNNSFRVFVQEQEEAIAEEQNPFDSALHGKNILNQSPARKMP